MINVPKPAGIDPNTGRPFEYLPYQLEGIEYASARSSALFADEMGLGKTIEAIGTVNLDSTAHRILIICPAKMKPVWRREFLKWDVKCLTIYVTQDGAALPSCLLEDVVIINYELLEPWHAPLREIHWDLLIVDEAHKLKDPEAIRTKEVFGCKKWREREAVAPIVARRKLFLTGTPIVNKPVDLWPIIRAIDPSGLGKNKLWYEQRYCDGKWVLIVPKTRPLVDGQPMLYGNERKVWQAIGVSNPDELQAYLRDKFMIRRLKKDVLSQLPPVRRKVVSLEPDKRQRKFIEQEREHRDYDAYLREMLDADIETAKFAEMSTLREQTALSKIPDVVEFVEELIENDECEKVCLFAHHKSVIAKLGAALQKFGVAVIMGDTKQSEIDPTIQAFQMDPSVRVFLGSITAAGEGLTLTAADTLIFAEQPWTAKDRDQVESRLDRMGQKGGSKGFVMVYHLVLEGSLDERQVQIIAEKESMSNQVLNPK